MAIFEGWKVETARDPRNAEQRGRCRLTLFWLKHCVHGVIVFTDFEGFTGQGYCVQAGETRSVLVALTLKVSESETSALVG